MQLAVEPLRLADPLLALPALERELQQRWLVWDAWTMGRRRVDLHPFVLSPAAHRAAVTTAESAWALVASAADRAALDPTGEGALYRFHPDVNRLSAAARTGGDRGVIARVDLLLATDGRWVACEVNADCPGGFNETLALPKLARSAGAPPHVDPTHVAGSLADALVRRANGGLIALLYATGYAEDLQVCAIVERLLRERGARVVRCAPTALRAHGDDGVSGGGERVCVAYRFYPLEYMAGQKNIDAIARATAAGNLASMSSFGWIHAQSKLAMARAFAHDPVAAGAVFPETRELSTLSRPRLLLERPDWVIKRDLSRVGDHVFVGALMTDEELTIVADEIAEVGSEDQAWIAQRFVRQRPIPTPWGDRLVTLGAYLLDGAFAGYFARFSTTSHCSHEALVLPVFVQGEEA